MSSILREFFVIYRSMKEIKLTVIGERIRELRTYKQISQAKLGNLLSVSQDTISLWEKSKSLPPVDCVIKLAEIFDVSCDYILGVKDF